MRPILFLLLALTLTGCVASGPLPEAVPVAPGGDPYSQAGAAHGAMTATAAEREQLARQAMGTEQAQRERSVLVAQEMAATGTAVAVGILQGTATAAAFEQDISNRATEKAMIIAGNEHIATVTGWGQAARATDYFSTLTVNEALKEAQERAETRAMNASLIAGTILAVKSVLVVVLGLLGAVLVWAAWNGAQSLTRKMRANAALAEAEAAAASSNSVRIIPQGFFVALPGKPPAFQPFTGAQKMLSPGYKFGPDSGAELTVTGNVTIDNVRQFLMLAQRMTGDDFCKVIPRYDRLGMNFEPWRAVTDWLDDHEYIRKVDRKTTACKPPWNLATILDDIDQYEDDDAPTPSVIISPMPNRRG